MLRVTWEWIGLDEPALDVSNTVAVEKDVEHDLLAGGGYAAWAAAAAGSPGLAPGEAAAIAGARPRVLELREHVRALFRAAAAGESPPRRAVVALNRASRSAPEWVELGRNGALERRARGSAADRLLAAYARSAMTVAAGELRVCGAPSCGMFYRPRRRGQRWCSEPCGTRARVARHYRSSR